MKVAVPTFGTRVSPRFDCAQEIAVVTVDKGCFSERLELAALLKGDLDSEATKVAE